MICHIIVTLVTPAFQDCKQQWPLSMSFLIPIGPIFRMRKLQGDLVINLMLTTTLGKSISASPPLDQVEVVVSPLCLHQIRLPLRWKTWSGAWKIQETPILTRSKNKPRPYTTQTNSPRDQTNMETSTNQTKKKRKLPTSIEDYNRRAQERESTSQPPRRRSLLSKRMRRKTIVLSLNTKITTCSIRSKSLKLSRTNINNSSISRGRTTCLVTQTEHHLRRR